MNRFSVFLACTCVLYHATADAHYALGCKDPEYQGYIEQRWVYFDAKNRRLLEETLRDYEIRASTSDNLYQVITSLSRHLLYSAQFEPVARVQKKIESIFVHADQMSVEQKIAGDVYDSFSSETHAVGIARAWIEYRQGNHDKAFEELMLSIDIADSAILGSFGPDFNLIRRLYRDGYIGQVVAYITKTEQFWQGERADELRKVWLQMIEAQCQIQFDSIDTIKAAELGLRSSF
jgi:hypothetical protein